MLEILIENVNNIIPNPAALQAAYNSLPLYRQEKIDRMHFMKDKILSASVAMLLKQGLEKIGATGLMDTIIYTKNNKPYFKDSGIYFNLSHSEEMAMCVISDREVGCDIEQVKEVDFKIAHRFFTGEEIKYIDTDEKFFEVWTLKESYIKCIGQGLSCPLNSFSVLEEIPGFEIRKQETISGYKAGICFKKS